MKFLLKSKNRIWITLILISILLAGFPPVVFADELTEEISMAEEADVEEEAETEEAIAEEAIAEEAIAEEAVADEAVDKEETAEEEILMEEEIFYEEETIAPTIRPAFAADHKIKIAMFGDSITWGTDGNRKVTKLDRVERPIPTVIEENLYVTCDNYGVGSMGWLNSVSGYGKAYDRISSIDLSGYDVVTLCYGVNDSSYKSGAYNTQNEETVMGQVNKCIDYLQNTYPGLTIILIAPFPTVANLRTVLSGKIYNTCQEHGVGFISQENGPLNENTVAEALPDNVHPSQEYYDLLGIWLAGEIQALTGAVSRIPVSSVDLKYTALYYNGSTRTQTNTTTVTGADGNILTKNTDYKITYKNNINVGKATMTVTGINRYNGTITKTFRIISKMSSVQSVSLKYTSLIYNGSERTQTKTTTITGADGTVLTRNTDYTITYENNVDIGKATMIITGKNYYEGTIKKTFKIVPKSTSIKSVKQTGKGKILIKWAKQTDQTTGYKIQISTDPNFVNDVYNYTIFDPDVSEKTKTGLGKGKTWYVRIRTYTKVDGVNYYSKWSEAKSVRLT